MQIDPQLIGFDIDGVVADTMEAFIRIARDDYDTTVEPHEITEFQVEDCLDMDPNTVEAIFDRLLQEPIDSGLKLMPHAHRVLTEFAEIGPVTFITARPDGEPIDKWLLQELGPAVYDKVRLVATGEHDGKLDYIKDMGLRYFVDDRAQTCVALSQEGINPFVFLQPWNHGKHALPVVENWLAIRALCFGAA